MCPVEDHPIHEKVRFKEVPLSTCHSSLPDRTKNSYQKFETKFFKGQPKQVVSIIHDFSDKICKQPDDSLPECRGCTNHMGYKK